MKTPLSEWLKMAGPFGIALWLFDSLVHWLAEVRDPTDFSED